MNRKSLVIFIGIFLVAFFVRVYNLEHTSRFIWDESRALVDMHRIWEKHQITFVGPISEDNLEMFPSLSYYLHLPSTVLVGFDPLGPVVTDVFLGLFLWVTISAYLYKKMTRGAWFLSILWLAVLTPYVETSRWFWNPNQIPLWITLALVGIFSPYSLSNFFGGVFLGLSIYHHYLALLTIVPLALGLLFLKKVNRIMTVWSGIFLSLLPMIFFEIKNRYYTSWFQLVSSSGKHFFVWEISNFWARLQTVLVVFSSHFINENWWLLFYIFLGILLWKMRKSVEIKILAMTLLFVLCVATLINNLYPYYLYSLVPIVLFVVLWGLQSRLRTAYVFVVFLILFAAAKTIMLISTPTWQGDLVGVRAINKIILNDSRQHINVAALSSLDPNTKGQRYRDVALINGKLLDGVTNYPQSEVLYVVSTNSSVDTIRQDQAWEFQTFRETKLTNSWQVSNFPYYLYRFEK